MPSILISSALVQLVAQAEAEKRNIGQADYIHREYDHAKKVQEDRERHVIEINKYAPGFVSADPLKPPLSKHTGIMRSLRL